MRVQRIFYFFLKLIIYIHYKLELLHFSIIKIFRSVMSVMHLYQILKLLTFLYT